MAKQQRYDGLYIENMYRPVFELKQAYAWALGGLATSASWVFHGGASLAHSVLPVAIMVCSIVMALKRGKEAIPLLRRQLKLQLNYWYTLDANKYRKQNMSDQKKAFLGKGFEWGVEEANRAYQLIGMRDEQRRGKLPGWLRVSTTRLRKDTQRLEGHPWIHGCGDEKPLSVDASMFYSHSIYTGLPGTGKTVMLTMQSVGSLHRGSAVIVIDPKNDPNWQRRLRQECQALDMPFYYFSPVRASESVRIDPTRNFVVTTELASRLANTLDGGGDAQAFKAYAWDSFYLTADALRFVGRKPSIKAIADYMLNRKHELAKECLGLLFQKEYGAGWKDSMGKMLTDTGGGSLLAGMILHYQGTLVPADKGHDTVSGYLGFVTHDASHQSKMLASTKPVLQQLTASPLDDLLSPDPDAEDERPIVDLKKFSDTGGVLYIALDSMGNSEIASVIAKLVMEDSCAAAAARYNHEGGEGRRVSMFVDETHAAISEGLINMLAQARGAEYELHISTQSYADLAEAAGADMADRIIGLTSNWFCLRVLDKQTRQLMGEQLPEVPVRTKQWQLNSSTNTGDGLGSYSGGVGERLMEQDKLSFPLSLLGSMPKFQYLGRLADGRIIHARVPILVN